MKKILVVAGGLNPGPLALATSALTIELQQLTECVLTAHTWLSAEYEIAAAVLRNSIKVKCEGHGSCGLS